MSKNQAPRNEQMKKILELTKEKKSKDELISAGIPKSTVSRNVPKLMKDKELEEIIERDAKGRPVKKYQNVRHEGIVSSEYLKLLMDNYRSKNKDKRNMAINDISVIAYCADEKIYDKIFIDFLFDEDINHLNIKTIKDDYTTMEETSIEEIIWKILADLDKDMDIQKELLEDIQTKKGSIYKKIFLDQSQNINNRESALDRLITIQYPKLFFIISDALKNMKYTEEKDRIILQSLPVIKAYFRNDSLVCKKKLLEIYDYQKDKKIKKRIEFLLGLCSFGSEYTFQYSDFLNTYKKEFMPDYTELRIISNENNKKEIMRIEGIDNKHLCWLISKGVSTVCKKFDEKIVVNDQRKKIVDS